MLNSQNEQKIKGDPLLEALVISAEFAELDESQTDPNQYLGITLIVGGLLISGKIISKKKYLQNF